VNTTIRQNTAYLAYVLRHKWFVFLECCNLGIHWRGIVHDWHKFLPSEWFPYVRFFHNPDGSKKQRRDKTGYYKPDDTGDGAFDYAWFLHQKRAKHHWQSWILPMSDGSRRALAMDDASRREMMADWRGAGRAQNTSNTMAWYMANKDKMQLHHETRAWIEKILEAK
jgi:hypothetical protein